MRSVSNEDTLINEDALFDVYWPNDQIIQDNYTKISFFNFLMDELNYMDDDDDPIDDFFMFRWERYPDAALMENEAPFLNFERDLTYTREEFDMNYPILVE